MIVEITIFKYSLSQGKKRATLAINRLTGAKLFICGSAGIIVGQVQPLSRHSPPTVLQAFAEKDTVYLRPLVSDFISFCVNWGPYHTANGRHLVTLKYFLMMYPPHQPRAKAPLAWFNRLVVRQE